MHGSTCSSSLSLFEQSHSLYKQNQIQTKSFVVALRWICGVFARLEPPPKALGKNIGRLVASPVIQET